jgi:nucleotide-binding universal stress UspA family protein
MACREKKGRDVLKMILVAYDGSEPAERVIEFALDMAQAFHAMVSVVAVVDRSEAPTAIEMAGWLESAGEHFEQAFGRVRAAAQARAVSVTVKSVRGHPVQQIVREAEEQKADVIVMGQQDGSRIERWLSRSASKGVLSRAPCPVVIVR